MRNTGLFNVPVSDNKLKTIGRENLVFPVALELLRQQQRRGSRISCFA